MKQRKRRRWWSGKVRFYFACVAGGLSLLTLGLSGPVAKADAPAVTDFAPSPQASLASLNRPLHALFWTRDERGLQSMMERPVYDDAVSGFAGQHPAWHLDAELSWFFGMPVYERDIHVQPTASDNRELV